MKKMIFLAASAAFFASGAQAGDVVPNHIRHPLHTAAVKMLAPKSVVRMGATTAKAASSATPVPTLAPGGLSNANIIAGLSWSALLGDTATYADNSVQQSDIGSTVAPLDSSGLMTAGTNTPTIRGNLTTGALETPIVTQGYNPYYTYLAPSKYDPMMDQNAFRIGGQSLGFSYAGSPTTDAQGSVGSLDLQGHPYGMYGQGCIFCVMTGQSSSFRPGISGGDWTVGTAASVIPSDSVAEYIETENERALMVLDVDHYDAPGTGTDADAVLKTAMTAQQMAMLRVGMWIHTNSIDGESTEPACQTAGGAAGCSLPRENWYRSVVKGWSSDGTKIYVTQWTSPTSSTADTDGQVPSTDTASLDTVNSDWGTPVVFVGLTPNVNGRNENLFYRHGYSSGTGGALGHSILSNEIDMMYLTTENHEVKVTGDDFVAENLVGSTTFNHDSVTEDSHFMLFNGDLPIGLWLNLGATADMIKSTSFNVHGNEGVSRSEDRLATTEIWSQGYADGSDAFNLLGYLQAETINAPSLTGANGTSYHFGVHIGGTNTTPTASPNNWGELIWNPKGQYQGSFGMCGGGSTGTEEACGVIQTQSGPVIMPYQVTVKNGGMTSGNGLVIGSQASGHVAALGVYQDSTDANALFELMEGSTTELSLSSTGVLTVAGGIDTSGSISSDKDITAGGQLISKHNITIDDGNNLVGEPSTGEGFVEMGASDSTTWKMSTSAGGDASLTGVYNLKSSGAATFSGSLIIPVGTPASATATCTQGQMEMDATYIYSCVAANTWHRVSNGSTW